MCIFLQILAIFATKSFQNTLIQFSLFYKLQIFSPKINLPMNIYGATASSKLFLEDTKILNIEIISLTYFFLFWGISNLTLSSTISYWWDILNIFIIFFPVTGDRNTNQQTIALDFYFFLKKSSLIMLRLCNVFPVDLLSKQFFMFEINLFRLLIEKNITCGSQCIRKSVLGDKKVVIFFFRFGLSWLLTHSFTKYTLKIEIKLIVGQYTTNDDIYIGLGLVITIQERLKEF